MTHYEANFEKGDKGNSIRQGVDLTIKIGDNPHYIIGQLIQLKMGRKKLIQIEQTGTMQNPQKDSITFEMVQKKRGSYSPLPKGKYRTVCYAYLTGKGGRRFTDDFEVI